MFPFRNIFLFIIFLTIAHCAIAQTDTLPSANGMESKPLVKPIKRVRIKIDSTTKNEEKKESLFFTLRTKDSILITDKQKQLVEDSSHLKDSLQSVQKKSDSIRVDSFKRALSKASIRVKDTSTYGFAFGGLYIPIHLKALALLEKERNPQGKEELFYVLTGLVAIIALARVIFPRYFINMFSLLFQTSYRQKQAIEQLTNNKISSLMLNIVFIVSLGIYVTLIFDRNEYLYLNFWILFGYSVAALAIIYLFKFVFLYFMGWIFNSEEAMESYSFVVFLSNKIIAIVLLPFIFILAFTGGEIASVSLVITYFLIGIALLYRFFIVMSSLRTILKVNPLHFFLYLCGVEILPLLLIYKAVVNFIQTSI